MTKENFISAKRDYDVAYVSRKLNLDEKDILFLALEHKISLFFHTAIPERLIITIKDSVLWNHTDLSNKQNFQIFVDNVHKALRPAPEPQFAVDELENIFNTLKKRGSYSFFYEYNDKRPTLYFKISDWCLNSITRTNKGIINKLTFAEPYDFIEISHFWCHGSDTELFTEDGWGKLPFQESLYIKQLNITVGRLVMGESDYSRIKNINAMPAEFRNLYEAHQQLKADELRKLKLNYIDTTPKLCTYAEVVTMVKQKGDVGDAIRIAVESNILIPYIKITSAHKLSVEQQLAYAWVEPNNAYKKRYKDLERLQKHMLDEIFKNGSYSGYHQSEWQVLKNVKQAQLMEPTVLEAWLGITSEIKFEKIELKDLVFLKTDVDAYFATANETQEKSSVNKAKQIDTTKIKSSPKERQQRTHALYEQIKMCFDGYVKKNKKLPTAMSIWEELRKNVANNDVIQEMTSWSAPNACINWITSRGLEKDMSRRAFENILSKFRNPIQ